MKMAKMMALALMICSAAAADEWHYHDTISGAAAPSSFDVNGDGLRGHHVTFTGMSSLGAVHGALMVEYDFPNTAPNPACPSGQVKIPIIVSAGTRATRSQAGQVFMLDDAASALFCLNPANGSFTMELKGKFVGGMGMFAGASGEYSYKGSGQVVLMDKIGMPFGGFTLTTQGKLIVPSK